jgi:hypothetical protein
MVDTDTPEVLYGDPDAASAAPEASAPWLDLIAI